MFYGEMTNCPTCGKKMMEEYCSNCVPVVNKSVTWPKEELDTD